MESRRWNIFAVIYLGVLIIVLGLLALLREVCQCLFCKFWPFDWRIDKALSYFLSGEPSRDCHAWSFFGDLCASLWPPRYRGLTPASEGHTGESNICLPPAHLRLWLRPRPWLSDCTVFHDCAIMVVQLSLVAPFFLGYSRLSFPACLCFSSICFRSVIPLWPVFCLKISLRPVSGLRFIFIFVC
jgi:hypothetical protein